MWATWQGKTKSAPTHKRYLEANGPKEDVVEDENANDGAALSYKVFMLDPHGAIRVVKKETGRMKRTLNVVEVR